MNLLKEEDALTRLKLYVVDGLSSRQIGDRIGTNARTIENWLKRHNAFYITRKNKKYFTNEEMTIIEEINYLRLRLRELSIDSSAAERICIHQKIARLVNLIPMTAHQLQELEKLESEKPSAPDGLNPILAERLDYIETEVEEGRTDEEIAEELGISYDEVAEFIGCHRLRPTPALPLLPRPDNVTPTAWVVSNLGKVKQWLQSGYKANEIAQVLKVSRSFIYLAQKGHYDYRND